MARESSAGHAGGRPASAERAPRDTAGRSFASSPGVRRRMQRQPMRDTQPELALRRALHGLGLRFRVDRPPLAGLRRRADVVFGPARVAVYVDGCFWHACPEHGTWPQANAEWWQAKLQRNVERDRETDAHLAAAGWVAVHVWEHDDPTDSAASVAELVRRRRSPTGVDASPQA